MLGMCPLRMLFVLVVLSVLQYFFHAPMGKLIPHGSQVDGRAPFIDGQVMSASASEVPHCRPEGGWSWIEGAPWAGARAGRMGQAGPDEAHGSGTGQARLGASDLGQAGPSGAGRVEPKQAEAQRGRTGEKPSRRKEINELARKATEGRPPAAITSAAVGPTVSPGPRR
jgi:hypothetical protein